MMDVLTINPNRKMYSTVLNYDGPIRVVAPVNYRDDGEIFDWAAYIGCGDTQQVADHGEKLYHHIAAAMFPDLPIGLYREQCVWSVAVAGDKLLAEQAATFFRSLLAELYRD